MKRKPVIAQLKRQLPALKKNYNYINSGGCGMVAMSLAKHLRANNIECDIVFVTTVFYSRASQDAHINKNNAIDINDLIIKADKAIRSGSSHASCWIENGHICIRVGERLFDSSGDVTNEYDAITDPISDEAMVVLLRQRAMWNDCFRSFHQPHIKEIHQRIRKIAMICEPEGA